jgi:hypothetical protein
VNGATLDEASGLKAVDGKRDIAIASKRIRPCERMVREAAATMQDNDRWMRSGRGRLGDIPHEPQRLAVARVGIKGNELPGIRLAHQETE